MELRKLIQEKERLEELIDKVEDGILVYSAEMNAKWQKELDKVNGEIKAYSINKDTGEITKAKIVNPIGG